MSFLHTIRLFLIHKLLEVNDHSIHSPFLFQFYQQVVKKARYASNDASIEALRRSLKNRNHYIRPDSLGAGSKVHRKKATDLRKIIAYGITKAKYSRLLYYLAEYFKCRYIIELGTSVGINTIYLSRVSSLSKLWTLEGNDTLVKIARQNFDLMKAGNIELIQGPIENSLPLLLNEQRSIDMAFIDACHTRSATLTWYKWLKPNLAENSIVVFDDIYWSAEMTSAWKEICKENRDKLCLDFFQFGVIIDTKDISQGYFHLSY